jgi:hypothetical protein
MEIHFTELIQYLFYALVCATAGYGVTVLSGLKSSVDYLNIQVGTLLEKSRWYEKELARLEDRIKNCENNSHLKGE